MQMETKCTSKCDGINKSNLLQIAETKTQASNTPRWRDLLSAFVLRRGEGEEVLGEGGVH